MFKQNKRGKEGTEYPCCSTMRAESDAAESTALRAAGADATCVNRRGTTGDPSRLIRLPLRSPNEFMVIEEEATALLVLSLSLFIAPPRTIESDRPSLQEANVILELRAEGHWKN